MPTDSLCCFQDQRKSTAGENYPCGYLAYLNGTLTAYSPCHRLSALTPSAVSIAQRLLPAVSNLVPGLSLYF